MSFDDNKEEEYYSEMDSSLIKVTAPIARLRFFFNSIFYAAAIGLSVCFLAPPLALLFGLLAVPLVVFPVLYLVYVNYAQRLWDILGDRKQAVNVAIVVILIVIFTPRIVGGLVWLSLAFIPGKLIK